MKLYTFFFLFPRDRLPENAIPTKLLILYTHSTVLNYAMLFTCYLLFGDMEIILHSQKSRKLTAVQGKPDITGQRWIFWSYTSVRKVRTGSGNMLMQQ